MDWSEDWSIRVARFHPLLGWLRLDAHIYSRTLDQSLIQRDRALELDRNHSGHAEGFVDWVWTTQLPELVRKDSYRQQVEDRCTELQRKSDSIAGEISLAVGGLIEERADVDSEREQLLALLDE